MAKKTIPEIEQLMKEFRDATDEYESAHTRAEAASRDETTALNRLSAAQKAIDDWHTAVKGSAPWNSEWHQQRRRTKECAEAA